MKEMDCNKNHITMEYLVKFFNFDLTEQLKKLQNQYTFKVSFKYSINLQNINEVIKLLRKCFIYFVNLRFKHLIAQFDKDFIDRNSRQLKEEYINIYLNYKYHKDSAINLLTVIIGLIIFNLIKKLWPDIELNQKIKYDIIHVIIHCTLGILMSDASIKLTLSKYLSKKIQQTNLNRKQPNEGSIKRRITNNQQNDLKSLLIAQLENQLKIHPTNVPLPVIEKKKIETYQYDQSQKQYYQNKPFKKLKKLRFYSNQISPAMMTKTQNQENFLPHVKSSLISYTPQIHGYPKKNNLEKYKHSENTIPVIKQESIIKQNKKTLTYWKKQIDRLKLIYCYRSKIPSEQSSDENQQADINIDLEQNSKLNKQPQQQSQNNNQKVKYLNSVPILYKKGSKKLSLNLNLSVDLPVPQKYPKIVKKQLKSHKKKIAILKHNKSDFEKSCIYNKPIQQVNSLLLKYKQEK